MHQQAAQRVRVDAPVCVQVGMYMHMCACAHMLMTVDPRMVLQYCISAVHVQYGMLQQYCAVHISKLLAQQLLAYFSSLPLTCYWSLCNTDQCCHLQIMICIVGP